jgi:hypothetical protein
MGQDDFDSSSFPSSSDDRNGKGFISKACGTGMVITRREIHRLTPATRFSWRLARISLARQKIEARRVMSSQECELTRGSF